MSARLAATAPNGVLRALTQDALDDVAELERAVYPFPWTRGNFVDSLMAGYIAWRIDGPAGELVAYCLAMRAADELHLLNITVAPAERGRGHARRLLAALVEVGRAEGASRLWLEVRVGNAEARAIYAHFGFAAVGTRRGYYPAPAGTREDAVVMSLDIAKGLDALV